MERPQANIERPSDEYDFELTHLQANAVALADELLKRKPEGYEMSCIDMVLVSDQHEMLAEIESGPLGHLLYAPDEQLALWSDGSRYPVLDLRKENATFTGMSLRVWGWEHDKVRYTKDREEGSPYEYKYYEGEKDKTRQIDIRMGYDVDGQSVTEELTMYVSTSARDYVYAHSNLSMATYAEMGYEGHGGKHDDELSDEAYEWFLDFVARHVGDNPKSFHDIVREQVEQVRELAREAKAVTAFNNLVKATWDVRALSLMKRRCHMLEGKTIIQGLMDPELAPTAAKALKILARQAKVYFKTGKLEEGDTWVIQLGGQPEDE